MSLSATVAVIVILDVALIGFLAWMMSHPRHLTSHVGRHERQAQVLDEDEQPDLIVVGRRV